MGVIRQKVVVKMDPDSQRESSEEDLIQAPVSASEGDDSESVETVGVNPPRQSHPVLSPRKSGGHRLVLKKGRRSRHRYENERSLITDEDDISLIWDIVDKTRSSPGFASLGGDLISSFFYDEASPPDEKKGITIFRNRNQRFDKDSFDPEQAFLSIGMNLRSALKKHLPLGILMKLEDEIRDFFIENPRSYYVAEELSSFERLLAHACSSYYHLRSRSFDDEGKRKLKIENPKSHFEIVDPSLTDYLKVRSGSF